jgi:hypothetical protein
MLQYLLYTASWKHADYDLCNRKFQDIWGLIPKCQSCNIGWKEENKKYLNQQRIDYVSIMCYAYSNKTNQEY